MKTTYYCRFVNPNVSRHPFYLDSSGVGGAREGFTSLSDLAAALARRGDKGRLLDVQIIKVEEGDAVETRRVLGALEAPAACESVRYAIRYIGLHTGAAYFVDGRAPRFDRGAYCVDGLAPLLDRDGWASAENAIDEARLFPTHGEAFAFALEHIKPAVVGKHGGIVRIAVGSTPGTTTETVID